MARLPPPASEASGGEGWGGGVLLAQTARLVAPTPDPSPHAQVRAGEGRRNLAAQMQNGPPMDSFDIVIIGSGINSLVCAAMLTRKGKRVCVLERNAVAGGCIRTASGIRSAVHYSSSFSSIG